MTAGQNRKYNKNMGYERSARTLAVVGLNAIAVFAPIALVIMAAALFMGWDGSLVGKSGVLTAFAAPALATPRSFLDVMEENERLSPAMRDKSRFIEQFDEKLASMIELIANTAGMSQRKRAAVMEEATGTSDFPILFGTVLERTLLAKYMVDEPDWQNYIKRGTQADFRPADAIGIYGLQGGFAEVKKQSEYKQDAQLGEGKVSISLKKYGRIFGMAWETIINDDLGAFNDISDRLSTASRRTEWREATKLIASATGPNTALYGTALAHPIDGATIANLVALPLTQENLGTVCQTLRRQVDSDGEPILIDGFELVVPPALEVTMWQVLSPAALIAVGVGNAAKTATSAAVVVQKLNITGHVNAYLPIIDVSAKKDTTWYVFAKLSSGAAAKLNFLQGHETPELVMKAPDKVTLAGGSTNPFDGDFENDGIWWRARHIMGGAVVDPRFTAASTGS